MDPLVARMCYNAHLGPLSRFSDEILGQIISSLEPLPVPYLVLRHILDSAEFRDHIYTMSCIILARKNAGAILLPAQTSSVVMALAVRCWSVRAGAVTLDACSRGTFSPITAV